MTRNTKGVIGFSAITIGLIIIALFFLTGAATVILPIFITLFAMAMRENYQYKKYLKPCGLPPEWDDVFLYGFTILFSGVVCAFVLILTGIIE